jgi:hypothetical protein
MNTLGLYLVNVILLTRLPLLFWDKPVKNRDAGAAWMVQAASLLAREPSLHVVLLGLGFGVANVVWRLGERQFPERLNIVRLLGLAVFLVLVGFFGSPSSGLSFRPTLPTILAQVSRHFALADPLERFQWKAVHSCGLGVLLCLNESNLLVRAVIEALDLRPKAKPATDRFGTVVEVEYRRGRVVGVLERLMIFFFVLEQQFGALGFVIAAKTMCRFKNLDDRDFAEYFLVGTLLSVIGAATLALLTRWLLA